MSPSDAQRKRDRYVTIFIGIVTLLAALTTGVLLRVEFSGQMTHVNWIAFALFAILLFVGETRTAMWMRFGSGGEVTPGYAFAYALALLGSPAGAVAVMALTSAYVDIRSHKPFRKILFNVADISLALSTGGLVLHLFGINSAITEQGSIPLTWGIGILAGGTMVFVLNGLLMCFLLALHTGSSFLTTLRQGFALSMTADGALLALAPLFVVAVEFSLVLVPLLGVTSFLVFQSARNALQRAHEANHDSLTKLLNRRAFSDRLTELLGTDGPPGGAGALLLLDLDGFKEINDRLGHQVGDSLLQGFAERLEREIPESAFAARLGGDEFAVVIPGSADIQSIKLLAFDLHNRLCRPLVVTGFPLSVAMSIGVAFAPQHAESATDLLAAADIAMYRAKRFHTNVELYQTSSSSRERGRIGLLADLATAIDDDELDVHFQPQLEMATGRIETVEALLRWHHPRLGPVPPDEFIGLAEQTELIGPLTECVLRRAANELSTLRDHDVKLAVNISARSLQDRHFVANVMRVLAETRFPAHRLELEVTERALATETERSRFTVEALRESNIRIAIDDFGTGYSSFLTLRDVAADRLKIDRTFITDIQRRREDLLIVKNVIELAHGLGLQVVAEGVETQDQWRILSDLGCDIAQGYGIAMPMSILDLRAWVAKRAILREDALVS
ncbi:MAG TPA: bifunctional diguanylate cyclase/phosphodiesterase [Ilumatobacteraceae bacterium]|nr:bifunctional diguanylate cyclase/phosphodiesterase [Ilumatobacteraceae bacterium]